MEKSSDALFSDSGHLIEQDARYVLPRSSYRSRLLSWQNCLIVFLILTNLTIILYASRMNKSPKLHVEKPEDLADIPPLVTLPETYTRFHWWTQYGSHNRTRDDIFWQKINPSHGFVAIDRKEAVKHRLPVSMYLPSDDSKGVYLLEAYHQLHCLKSIREGFWNTESVPEEHSQLAYHMEHCFDTLRQSIMCNADNTHLYTFGDNTAGDGQMHQCRSWDVLRDYATRFSACYLDSDHEILLGEHFGHCDDGVDGLEWPNDSVDY